MANEAWIKRQTATPEARKLYEEERLILWTTEAIAEAMADRSLTRAQVAEALGTSRPNVTQLLSGSRNMTLRTLAGLAHACGMRASFHLEPLTDSVFAPLEDRTIQNFRLVRVEPVLQSQFTLQPLPHTPEMNSVDPVAMQVASGLALVA